jgi:hypothetical protein
MQLIPFPISIPHHAISPETDLLAMVLIRRIP